MKDNFIMLPTVDFCFKELMQNPKVRKGFIAALLKVDPDEIHETTLLPTILLGGSQEEKQGILDVRVRLENGAQLDIEMQVTYFSYWDKRVLFYLGRMYTEQLSRGESYESLKKCIHVSILDFVCFPDDRECYRTIHLRDDKTGRLYTDMLELHILELGKLPREACSEEEIINWMRFFGGKNREEFEHMARTNEYLDEAYQELMSLSADERKRLEYETREKALRDYNSQMKSAKDYGLAQGRSEGLSQGLSKGRIESKTEDVLELLEELGAVPEDLHRDITEEQDLEKLRSWLKLAAKAESIEEFREKASL